jgi:hypothetical protein
MKRRKHTSILIAVLLTFWGCSRIQNRPSADSPPTTEVVSSTPPFKTLEPDRYQAIRIITLTNSSGSSEVSRTLIAKHGTSRFEQTLGPNTTVYLYLPQGRFILLPEARVYSDSNGLSESIPQAPALEESSDPLLHQGGTETLYRQMGHEEIGGRRLMKYQIVVNNSAVTNVTNSDAFVWVDEELKMPIKTAMKSANGNRTTIELTQIKLDVDGRMFQIPEGYRKVSSQEIRQALTSR